MELKVTKEKISSAEVIFAETNEHSVELDYILPDYCPEIFKILKCIAIPHIISYEISGDKLNYEMTVSLRILYCAENSTAVQIIEQKLAYSKKIDLGKNVINPDVKFIPQISYMNCRAVNQRRIDVRGAVSIEATVTDVVLNDVITDVSGGGVQLKKSSITYPSDYIKNNKTINISDEFDLGSSKPPILNVIRCNAAITSSDKKIIANKLIIKGEICINMLYTYYKEDIDGIETMQFTMPFSQVIDMEGIDERFTCSVDMSVISCEIEPRSNGDGVSGMVECNVKICVSSSAYRTTTSDLIIDEYSTLYKTTDEKMGLKLELPPDAINSVCVVKNTLTSSDEEISCIYDAWCTIKNYTVHNNAENNRFTINGIAIYCIIGKNTDGMPVVYEKEEPFTAAVQVEKISDNSRVDIKLIPISCSYNLASDSSVEIKAEIKVVGCLRHIVEIQGITDICINEDDPINKNQNYALKIYYTDGNEDLWEIAKKYGTSVSAIIEENEIEDDIISGSGMILIPIV
ncbi:MAG: DUF3794 domain-containing protein [Oscillospiraceae bacterium]|nr:DUF3794 domain-containing protein [Oscillospiraceae bacterium]